MIKTTIVGYGAASLKLIDTYMDRLESYFPRYYPSISWYLYNETLKDGHIHKYYELLDEKVLVRHPNIVFVTLGSSDMDKESKHFIEISQYELYVQKIIEKIKSHNNRTGLNGCIPIPILITPVPVVEDRIEKAITNNRIKQYAYAIKKVAVDMHVPYIDLFNILMDSEERYEAFIAEDGIHLNQKGQDALYDMAFIELTKLINYTGVLKDRDVIIEDEVRM